MVHSPYPKSPDTRAILHQLEYQCRIFNDVTCERLGPKGLWTFEQLKSSLLSTLFEGNGWKHENE